MVPVQVCDGFGFCSALAEKPKTLKRVGQQRKVFLKVHGMNPNPEWDFPTTWRVLEPHGKDSSN